MKLSQAKRDVEAEDNGVWAECVDFSGVHVKVRSLDAPDFRNAVNKRIERARRDTDDGVVPPTVSEKIYGEEIAKRLWMDVSGLEDDDGNPLQLTKERGQAIMTSREYRDLANEVTAACQRVSRSSGQKLEADKGNSGRGTSGSGNSANAKSGSGS